MITIKSNDLRIGNFVKQGGIYTISGISKDCCFGIHATRGLETALDLSLMQPIELSPELLDKCGFELDYSPQVPEVKLGNFIMNFNWPKENELSRNFNCGERIDVHIKYLHQLQNLYYALTQTELTIKL